MNIRIWYGDEASSFDRKRYRKVMAVLLLLLLCIACIGSEAYRHFALPSAIPFITEPITEPVIWAHVEAPLPVRQQGDDIQVKLVTLTPRGFDPEEVTTSKSRFVLDVENLTGLQDVYFTLENGKKELVQTKRLLKGSVNWARAIELPPGTYVLAVANHPTWRCTINVNP